MHDEDSDGFPSMLSDLGFIASVFACAGVILYVVLPWVMS